MMIHRVRRIIWIAVFGDYCFSFLRASSFNLQSSTLFDNLHKHRESTLNITQTQSNTPTLTPSPPPPSKAPLQSSDDDWYFSYRKKQHTKPAHNDSYVFAGVGSNDTNDDECLGGLDQLACRGKMAMSKTDNKKMDGKRKPQMMMSGMSRDKDPKMCGNRKRKKSCLDSSMPSIVPSAVPQSRSETPKSPSTVAPNSDETGMPSTTNVPSTSFSPTLSKIPSRDTSPTEYPTFETIQSGQPSLPPNFDMPITSPTQQPKLAPSYVPIFDKSSQPSSVPSYAPIPSNSLLQRATPFGLAYGLDSGNGISITMDHITEVQDVTIEFLEDYLDVQLFGNNETVVDYYVSNVETFDNATISLSASIVYGFGIVFVNSTTFILTQQEVDILIESGFRAPFVDVLIATIQQLDPDNPFSSTISIVYAQSNVNNTKGGRASDDSNMNMTEPPIQVPVYEENDDGEQNLNSTNPPIQIHDTNNSGFSTQTSPPIRVDDSIQSFDNMIKQYELATVKVTPFILTYQWIGLNVSTNGDLDPTIGEIKAASNLTLAFLDEYLHTMLDLSQPGAFTYFVGYSAGMIHEQNVIEYRTGLHFQNTSMFNSIQREVDMLIQTAFIPHYVEPLIKELRSQLPSTNPFSKTLTISFEFTSLEEQESTRGMSSLQLLSLVVAIVFSVVASVLILLYRHRKWQGGRRQRNVSRVPRIVIHSNHDPIHGDLIEIISSDDPDENDVEPQNGLRFVSTSMHERLMSPSTAIADADEANGDSSASSSSRQYKTRHQVASRKSYSDGWSSTSSSTSTLSVTLPCKYTEPNIFEEVD